MSAHDPDIIKAHSDGYDRGFTTGFTTGATHARRDLLPMLKGIRQELPRPQWGDAEPEAALWHSLDRAIADIETT
jgi:hypothetical protein